MPSIIESTTPRALEVAIVQTIAAIVPTEVSHREGGWVPAEENEAQGRSSLVARLFYVEISPGGEVPGGITGNGDTECYLALDIFADYRAFQAQEIGHVVSMDQWDLFDAMQDQINVIPGLTQVTVDGQPDFAGLEGEARYRFPFQLQYMRARR